MILAITKALDRLFLYVAFVSSVLKDFLLFQLRKILFPELFLPLRVLRSFCFRSP